MSRFGQRLRAAIDAHGPLCVGIDPHSHLLVQWDLEVSAAGAREFGLRVVEAAAGRVGIIKPQVAFFERYGSAGYAALEDVLSSARAAGLIVIADAKRGDIGSTMEGYAAAWLTPGSPLEADAVTLSPYLGPESLHDTIMTAVGAGKGAFVLAATSNPEAVCVQSALTRDASAGETVAARVVRDVMRIDRSASGASAGAELASIGFVVGATVDRHAVGLDDNALRGAPILAPGFGAQGAEPADLERLFGALSAQVVANESRSILSAGPAALSRTMEVRAAAYAGSRGY